MRARSLLRTKGTMSNICLDSVSLYPFSSKRFLKSGQSNFSWRNPVERIMSIVNLGLQSVGLARQEMGEEVEAELIVSVLQKYCLQEYYVVCNSKVPISRHLCQLTLNKWMISGQPCFTLMRCYESMKKSLVLLSIDMRGLQSFFSIAASQLTTRLTF